jgi:hypothetical protein
MRRQEVIGGQTLIPLDAALLPFPRHHPGGSDSTLTINTSTRFRVGPVGPDMTKMAMATMIICVPGPSTPRERRVNPPISRGCMVQDKKSFKP